MPPLPLPDPELADDAIRLRAPSAADVPAIIEACQDPDIQHFTFVPVPYREDDARDWVGGAPARAAAGEGLSLVIADIDDHAQLLGTVGLLRPDWVQRTIEIGYWVAPWARGRGLAVRAVKLLAPWALRTLDLARIACDVDADNAASRQVAQRAGFVAEDVAPAPFAVKGRTWNLVSYSLRPEHVTA
ncbi:MAG TPA: GNAT family N-acetyltransferase [Baekduia sp.]|nr:GNAT family N-acetyltransferase [Baekduia sp.]